MGEVHFAGVHGISRGSRARVVHFLLGGVLEGFAGIFETELPCGSGALRGSSRDFPGLSCESGALFVRGCFGRVCRNFETELPCGSGAIRGRSTKHIGKGWRRGCRPSPSCLQIPWFS